jgi:hypothetical protein
MAAASTALTIHARTHLLRIPLKSERAPEHPISRGASFLVSTNGKAHTCCSEGFSPRSETPVLSNRFPLPDEVPTAFCPPSGVRALLGFRKPIGLMRQEHFSTSAREREGGARAVVMVPAQTRFVHRSVVSTKVSPRGTDRDIFLVAQQRTD